jgi:inhibitor of cysteine peptidase
MSLNAYRRRLAAGIVFAILCVLGVATIAGCGSGTTGNKTQGTVSSMKVTAGQTFTISLQSNQTTGYQWQLAAPLNTKVVKKVSSIYKPDTSGSAVGTGGVEIWTFKAEGKGAADIKMKYVRPGDKSAKPAEERVFKITVQ